MLLEYADRGSLEQAISTGRFLKRGTRTVDMVRPAYCLAASCRTLAQAGVCDAHARCLWLACEGIGPGYYRVYIMQSIGAAGSAQIAWVR